MAGKSICKIDGCNKPHLARGLCPAHYWRLRKHGDPLGGRTPEGVPLRYLQETVFRHETEECLMWPFARTGDGYGVIFLGGKTQLVHRIVCESEHGNKPTAKHEVAHGCGNGHLGCVNPKHLRWATPQGNNADKWRHGTHLHGEMSPRAKVTARDVIAIRANPARATQSEMADRYGISQSSVSEIVNRNKWKWLR